MSRVKSKDTALEKFFGKSLWQSGVRYRKHYSKLVGKPDFAIVKYKIAIFCDSEFWHGYNWKEKKKELKTNKSFWVKKIERNIERDIYVTKQLKKDGWIVLRFWGRDIKANIDSCIAKVEQRIAARKRHDKKK